MSLTLRSASTSTATTKGAVLTHAEMDANWLHLAQSANTEFLQSGSGASSQKMQEKGRKIVHASDYGSKMTTTPGADINAAITYLNGIGGGTVLVGPGSFTVETGIVLKSKVTLSGAGWTSTVLTAASALNAPVMKNSDTSGGNTDIFVRHLRVDGNGSNQSSGDRSGIVFQNVDYSGIDNVWVTNCKDWGFGIYEGDYISLKDCMATAIIGINDSNGVRAGYLFGTTSTLRYANNITVENCVCRDVVEPYVDGFIFEQGTGIVVRGCIAKNVPYSGFKLNAMNNVSFIGNQADNCLVGYQKLSGGSNVAYIGNLAYRNSGAGFLIGNADTGTVARGLIVNDNFAVDNGQNAYSALYGASGTRYGFAFEGTASSTTDRITVKDNVAIDNGGATQGRGISWGSSGTFSNVFMDGNLCKGNTADYVQGASLQTATFTYGQHIGFDSGSVALVGGQGRKGLQFWVDNVSASAGVTLLSDGISGRGYVMPKAGYLLGVYVKSTAPVTDGTMTVVPRKNGSDFGSGLNITSGTFNSREETFQSATFDAGDTITCRYSSSAGLLPDGTNDFDVTVVVVY